MKSTKQQEGRHLVRLLAAAAAATAVLAATLQHSVDAFSTAWPLRNRHCYQTKHHYQQQLIPTQLRYFPVAAATPVSDDGETAAKATPVASFDEAVANRYACTRYRRHDGNYEVPSNPNDKFASPADPGVLKLAREALALSTRAPTGFNAQPYKLLLVESVDAKKALSKYCIGRNIDRVLDSDCTVVFLADRQAMLSWKDYKGLLEESSPRNRSKTPLAWLKLRALVALFSGGIPLPKVLAGPISFGIRLAMRVVSWVARARLVVPTLSSPECWSQKNTMLVAMSYILGCSARGLETTPMEGYLSWGVRKSLRVPRRYTIPLIVSTGRAYTSSSNSNNSSNGTTTTKDGEDDMAMSHGTTPDTATPRFPIDTVVYENGFP
jgi:nitroreductase